MDVNGLWSCLPCSYFALALFSPEINFNDKGVLVLNDTTNQESILGDYFRENRGLKELIIQLKGNNAGWVVFSKSPWDNYSCSYSYPKKMGKLPNSIGKLREIEVLDISFLGLTSLPQSITRLTKLKSLNISFNRIPIANEIDKLRKLKNLRFLRIYGCEIDESILWNISSRLPDVTALASSRRCAW